MAKSIILRGAVTAAGLDPADRIVVKATVSVSDAVLDVLAGSSSEYTALCTLSNVTYTRASNNHVDYVGGPLGSLNVKFRYVSPTAPDKGRIVSCNIADYLGGLYYDSAYVTLFDKIVDTVEDPPPVPTSPTPDGLLGNYYVDGDIVGYPQTTRVDPVINFLPFNESNVPGDWMPGDPPWAIRWSGEIQAPVAGGYQFRIRSDDGSRLTLDGVIVQNDFGVNHGSEVTHVTTTQTYTANQRIAILLDLRNSGGPGAMVLEWKYPGQDWQIVPTSCLYSGAGKQPPALPTPTTPLERMRAYITTINRYPEA